MASLVLSFVWLVGTKTTAIADEGTDVPSPGIIASTDDFSLDARKQAGELSRIGDVFVARCNGSDPEAWSLQIQSPTLTEPLAQGDVLCVQFDARTVQTDKELGEINVSAAKQNPWAAIQQENGFRRLDVPRTWHTYAECFRASDDFAAGLVNVSIHVGNQAQHIEVRNLRLSRYVATPDEQLPQTPLIYPGADDRSWVLEANGRIDRHRRVHLAVSVIDAEEKPIPNAKIRVVQKRHQYAFGTFVGNVPIKAGEDAVNFREQTKKWFNRVTLPRYWADWGTDSPAGVVQADATAQWARSEGFELKTHLLLYPKFIPARVKNLQSDPLLFRREIENAMTKALRDTKDLKCVAWDAINELRDVSLVGDMLGKDYYAHVFNLGNQSQPHVNWFINEYGILTGGRDRHAHLEIYMNHIQQILNDGGALEGIGLQGHFNQSLLSMPDVWQVLDRLAEFHLPIEITEFDVDTTDETTQAQYTRDLLTAVFAHPSTTGFTTWGFWEGDMWRPRGAMIREDWTVKPNGEVWQDQIYRQWWSDEELQCDVRGQASTRVYKGRHRIEAESGGQVRFGEFNVTKDSTVVLQLGI